MSRKTAAPTAAKARKAVKKATRTVTKETASAVEMIKDAPKMAQERVNAFIESGKPALARAQAAMNETGRTLSKKTMAIRKDLAHRMSDVGTRVGKERKALGKKVESAVKTTLASLNIPTRSEINLLAKRVEELSLKIDRLKRR
ncbi:MAG: phasin family protein [Vicinamibacteria bacterium]